MQTSPTWRHISLMPPAADPCERETDEDRLNMDNDQDFPKNRTERRNFLRFFGAAIGTSGMAVAAGLALRNAATAADASTPAQPAIPGYDWTKHRWAYGIDATKCIGCLRCVDACKTENNVIRDAHHFRTWVERYVYLEGEEKAHI